MFKDKDLSSKDKDKDCIVRTRTTFWSLRTRTNITGKASLTLMPTCNSKLILETIWTYVVLKSLISPLLIVFFMFLINELTMMIGIKIC